MRKIRLLLLVALVATIAPLPSRAGTGNQHAEGTALVPTRFAAGDPTTDAYPGVQRRIDIATMGYGNGVAGYVFQIDQSTWCNQFDLKLVSSSGTTPDDPKPDVDIYFYSGWDDVIGSDVISAYGYEKHTGGGESGYVPPDTTRAMVFSYNTFNAAFTYDSTANDLDPEASECIDALPTPQ